MQTKASDASGPFNALGNTYAGERSLAEIRALRPQDDLRDLIELSMSFFDEYEDHHEEFFKIDRLSESHIVEFFTRSVGSAESETFVAVEEATAVGYITVSVRTQPSFYKVKKVGAISGFMVQKDSRHRGIGTELLAAATGFFQEKGVRYYTVYTSINNHAAITFYEINGMTPLNTTFIGEITGVSRPSGTTTPEDR